MGNHAGMRIEYERIKHGSNFVHDTTTATATRTHTHTHTHTHTVATPPPTLNDETNHGYMLPNTLRNASVSDDGQWSSGRMYVDSSKSTHSTRFSEWLYATSN